MDAEELRSVLEVVRANEGQCGRSMVAKILRGSRDARLLALGLDNSAGYGALKGKTIVQIGYAIDEALSLGLIAMRDEGWNRGRKRQEAHFPVLYLTARGAEVLAGKAPPPAQEEAPTPQERARHLAMRAMVQGAYALEDHKHERIEAADFVRESPGDHLVLFAMERHPAGQTLMCLYLWEQRTNTVTEISRTPIRLARDRDQWFGRELRRHRKRLAAS